MDPQPWMTVGAAVAALIVGATGATLRARRNGYQRPGMGDPCARHEKLLDKHDRYIGDHTRDIAVLAERVERLTSSIGREIVSLKQAVGEWQKAVNKRLEKLESR